MASKPLIIASLIGASIGVPYAISQTKNAGSATITPLPSTHGTVALPAPPQPAYGGSAVAAPAINHSGAVAPPLGTAGLSNSASTPRSPSAEQALRFDVTKEWVYQNWDRKSTGPTDVGLFAVRVPLVSGTQTASLAGSLTYYFNNQNQVEHISFRGRTGDPSRLIHFLRGQYQFQPAASPTGEQVYQVADRGGVQSELRARSESLVTSASPLGTYVVELELARPGSERYLPPRPSGLDIPQTPDAVQSPSAEQAANSTTTAGASEGSGSGSYFDRVRYATPQEASQVLWKRWPN